ncbi:MAG: hypothetical protein WA709_02455 [Stellaceae bacterium]
MPGVDPVFGGNATVATLAFFHKTAENSDKTASVSLFCKSSDPPRPRISAIGEVSLADNFPEKQQKQREAQCLA